MQSAPQGTTIDLDAEYRDGTGNLFDPSSILVTIYRPDDSVLISNATPYNLTTGIYQFSLTNDPNALLGFWVIRWTAQINGNPVTYEDLFEVTASGTAPQPSTDVDNWVAGNLVILDLLVRDENGVLADLVSPVVSVLNPNNFVFVDMATPVHLATGLYRYAFQTSVSSDSGFWRADWEGTLNATAVATEDVFQLLPYETSVTHLYGASISGVQALLPWLEMDSDTRLTVSQINGFITSISAEVSFRIGDYTLGIPDTGLQGRVTQMAKYVVELGAAAMTEDAVYPTRAAPNQSSYGTVLWQRYQDALQSLVKVVDDATPGNDPGAGFGSGGAVSSSPPLFFTRMPI